MGSVWLMICREWRQWHWLVWGALGLGLMAWAAPFWPAYSHLDSGDLRMGACALFGICSFLMSLFFLGGSLSHELTEGRFSFYLSRPISTTQYWAGKTLGALSLLWVIPTLIVLPTAWSEPSLTDPVLDWLNGGTTLPLTALEDSFAIIQIFNMEAHPSSVWTLLGLVLGLCGFMLAVHWIRTAAWVRGSWLGLDVVALGLCAAFLFWVREDLVSAQAFGGLAWLEHLWALASAPVLWLAGRRQHEVARVDAAFGYRLFSITAWTGLGALCLVTFLLRAWVLGGTADDLRTLSALSASPDGQHVLVAGELGGRLGREQAFLLDLKNTEDHKKRVSFDAVEAGGGFPAVMGWHWAKEGRQAFWAECRRVVRTDCELWTQDFERDAKPRPLKIYARSYQARVAYSPDGRWVALGNNSGIEVYSTTGGKLHQAVKVEGLWDLEFVGSGHLRSVHFWDEEEIRQEIRVLDLESGVQEVTGSLPNEMQGRTYALSGDRKFLLFNSLSPRRYEIRDALSGEILADLNQRFGLEERILSSAVFLSDDRLVLVAVEPGEVQADVAPAATVRDYEIYVLDAKAWRDGEEGAELVQKIAVPSALQVRLGHRLEEGAVTVMVRRDDPQGPNPLLDQVGLHPMIGWSTWLLKPGAAELELFGTGFVPEPVPRTFEPGDRRVKQNRVFMAGRRELFVLADGGPKVLVDGFKARPRSEKLVLGF